MLWPKSIPLQDDDYSAFGHQVCSYAVESTVMHLKVVLQYSKPPKDEINSSMTSKKQIEFMEVTIK